MKCIFLYNPNSGKGKILKKLDYIKTMLESKFEEVELYQTKSSSDTIDAAKAACDKYDVIVFSGGDGTFNDVTCGVASQPKRPILGYIPSGTVNDIATNLGISKNVKRALKVITDGNTMYHDVGKINDRYFMYVVGIGTFTGVSYRTKQKVKRALGKIAYLIDGIKDFIKPITYQVTLKLDNEEKTIDTPLLLVLNSISVGGMRFNKGGHLNDGLFDVMVVKRGIHKGIFNIARLFIQGLLGKRRVRNIEYFRSSKIIVEVDGEPTWTVDGEAGAQGSATIENIHNHLQIFVPQKHKRAK